MKPLFPYSEEFEDRLPEAKRNPDFGSFFILYSYIDHWLLKLEDYRFCDPNFHGFVKENKSLLKAESCVWEAGDLNPSNRPEFYLGCKGLLYIELSLSGATADRHSKYAAILDSPTWRLISLLRGLKDETGKILIDGFYDDILPSTAEDSKLISNIEFDETANLKFLA